MMKANIEIVKLSVGDIVTTSTVCDADCPNETPEI